MLSLSHVSFAYDGREVLKDISLDVSTGEIVAILGPNASGKTTLLKNMAGLVTPTSGDVTWEKQSLSFLSPRERARRIGYIPQEEEVFLSFTVEQVVSMGRSPHLGFLGLESSKDRDIVARALETMRLEPLKNRPVQELSGGERQRVALSRVLAQETKFWILDEPTSHLDLHFQHELMALCRKANETLQTTILFSLHDPHLAARYASRVVFLKEGQIVADGPTAKLLSPDLIRQVFDLAPEIPGPFF